MRPDTPRNLYLLLLAAGVFPFLVNGYVNSIIFRDPPLYWSFEVLSWIVLPIVVFTIAVRKGGLRFAEIGLHGTVFGKRNLVLLAVRLRD